MNLLKRFPNQLEKNMDKKQEELLQLQMLEQEASQYGEQLNLINRQINEMNLTKANLKKIKLISN